MVTPDKIDDEETESLVDIWPARCGFRRRTQSQGELLVKGQLIPGEALRFRLKEGTKDLKGDPLEASAEGFEMSAPELRVIEEGYGERSRHQCKTAGLHRI